MFMGKSESDNIKKLLKIRMRDSRGFQTVGILSGFYLFMDLIEIIKKAFSYETEAVLISTSVYSDIALALTVLACIYYTFQYCEFNEVHRIFPQTAKTRFLSFELYIYFLHIFTQALALGFYLLEYLFLFLFDRFIGNLNFAYTINPVFIITGFFTYLFYGLILCSIIMLIAAIIRRFRWWSLALYFGIILFLVLTRNLNFADSLIRFYFLEPSIPIFFIKVIITWLIPELLTHILERYTHVITAKKFMHRHIIVASVLILSLLVSTFANRTRVITLPREQYDLDYKDINLSKDKPYRIIDADSLPSDFTLDTCIDYRIQHVQVFYGDPYYNKTDDKINVYFIPQKEIKNDVNMSVFTHPRLNISLKNNKLFLQVTQDKNVKVVSLYPYNTLMRFDCFKNKAYANKYFGNIMCTVPARIVITTPKNKNITIHETVY